MNMNVQLNEDVLSEDPFAELRNALNVELQEESEKQLELILILDKSGSMAGNESMVQTGCNGLVKSLGSQARRRVLLTIVQFDHQLEVPYFRVPLSKITKVEYEIGGSTAIYDAIGTVIYDIKRSQLQDKQLFDKLELEKELETANSKRPYVKKDYIAPDVHCYSYSDGYENSSYMFSLEMIRNIISECISKDGWRMYYGGDYCINTAEVAQSMGIAEEDSAFFTRDRGGFNSFFKSISRMIGRVLSGKPPIDFQKVAKTILPIFEGQSEESIELFLSAREILSRIEEKFADLENIAAEQGYFDNTFQLTYSSIMQDMQSVRDVVSNLNEQGSTRLSMILGRYTGKHKMELSRNLRIAIRTSRKNINQMNLDELDSLRKLSTENLQEFNAICEVFSERIKHMRNLLQRAKGADFIIEMENIKNDIAELKENLYPIVKEVLKIRKQNIDKILISANKTIYKVPTAKLRMLNKLEIELQSRIGGYDDSNVGYIVHDIIELDKELNIESNVKRFLQDVSDDFHIYLNYESNLGRWVNYTRNVFGDSSVEYFASSEFANFIEKYPYIVLSKESVTGHNRQKVEK